MRITVVPSDKRVTIDGKGYEDINLSSLDPSIHAIQWYGTDGEVEIKDARGRIVENRVIDSFEEFAFVVTLWEAAKEADEFLKAQINAAAQTS